MRATVIRMSAATKDKISKVFPKALSNTELVSKVTAALGKYNYGSSSLLACSLCADEVNRDLENDFRKHYGDNFSMGGLAGFPFGGITSFGAMAHHIPDGGSCLVVYGPHVGVDSSGTVGKIDRRGMANVGACCGSAVAASGYVASVEGGGAKAPMPDHPTDIQQYFVGNMLLPHGKRLASAEDPMVDLPLALFEEQHKMMDTIVCAACGEVHGDGKIALLGGIQINTPAGMEDHFLPLNFEVRDNKGGQVADLMSAV